MFSKGYMMLQSLIIWRCKSDSSWKAYGEGGEVGDLKAERLALREEEFELVDLHAVRAVGRGDGERVDARRAGGRARHARLPRALRVPCEELRCHVRVLLRVAQLPAQTLHILEVRKPTHALVEQLLGGISICTRM